MNSVTLRRAGLITAAAAMTLANSAMAAPPAAKPAAKPATKPAAKPASAPATPAQPKLPDNIAARVNGHDITRDQVLAVFNMTGGRDIVRQMIQVVAMESEAKKQGITITDTELNNNIKLMKDRFVQNVMQNGQGAAEFKDIAAKYGITEEYVRYSAHLELLRRKTFTKAMMAQIPAMDDQIKLEHILIATVPLGGPQATSTSPADQAKKDADAKTKIDALQADIAANKITFEEAARKNSDDSSNAANGGALDWVGHGVLDKAFEEAAYKLQKPGDISPPVKSQFGWHLIKLVAKGKDATAAEKADYHKKQMAQIEQQANNQQAVQSWMESVLSGSKIVVNPTVKLVPNASSPAASLFPAPVKSAASAKEPAPKKK